MPLSDQHIRLLQLTRPAEGEPLSCTLEKVPLDDLRKYDALSYAWGDLNDRGLLVVNGYELMVTVNLLSALRKLWNGGHIRGRLWVDAVCINQADNTEKGFQIQLMHTIFRHAETVYAFIGHYISYGASATVRKWPPERVGDKTHITECFLENPEIFSHILEILQWPRWKRLWVVQEVMAARKVMAHIGSLDLPFSVLTAYIAQAQSLAQHAPRELLVVSFRGSYQELLERPRLHLLANNIGSTFTRNNLGHWLPILQSLSSQKATDERDHIYGALALLLPDFGIKADYNRPVEQVFEDATVQVYTRAAAKEITGDETQVDGLFSPIILV